MKALIRYFLMSICLLICFSIPSLAFAASDNVKPTISGVGNKTIYIGASFNPLSGVTAKDNADGTITKKIKVSGKVNTKKAGTFKLTYSVTDKAKNKKTVSRTITVKKDTTKPTISGVSNKTIYIGASFSPLSGVTAKDNADGTITKKIKVSGKVNTKKTGTYKLTYTVSDKAKNKKTVSRAIIVKEKASSKYISIAANGNIQPGIYKLTNTKLEPVVKGNVYKFKYLDEYPIKEIRGAKVSFKKSAGFDIWEYLTDEYTYPLEIKNNIYFARFEQRLSYVGGMCGGGFEDLYSLYKSSNGKVTKVNNDYISASQGSPLYTYNGNLYYFQGKGLGSNYNVIQLTNTNKKSTLIKNVEDFWIAGSKAYYQKNGTIYNYNWQTKKSTAIKTKKDANDKFYSNYACGEGNYTKVENGLIYSVRDKDNSTDYYHDYSTGKSTKFIMDGSAWPLEILPSKNILLSYNYDNDEYTYFLYDLKGKKLKTLNIPKNAQIIDISLSKREIKYLSSNIVKILKF